jgi:uncharacterized protein
MAEMKSYKPGMFSWADLATSDQAAAKKFYGELLGWQGEDLPMGQGGTYTMARHEGKDVAGISAQRPEEKQQKIPPHWNVYFTVTDVDEMASKAGRIGGKIVAAPMDVMDVGRMAVIQDPSGAMFCLWQAKKHNGASWVNAAGGLCWAELETSNVDACGSFYNRLFGWTQKPQDVGNFKYTVFNEGQEQRAGMMGQMHPGTPSHWTVYFGADDCDKRTAKAKSLGAKVVVEPQDIPNVGRFSMLFDPQGAFFALLQPKR